VINDELTCYCGTSNTVFLGKITACAQTYCDSADAQTGNTCIPLEKLADLVLSGACSLTTSGIDTLPNSLTSLIPSATAVVSGTSSTLRTTFATSSTSTSSTGQTQSTTGTPESLNTVSASSNNASTGALIGGIPSHPHALLIYCRHCGWSSWLPHPRSFSHVSRPLYFSPSIRGKETGKTKPNIPRKRHFSKSVTN
jgi:hypothetical protein